MRILYIDIDALTPSHLGCYGYHRNTSPTIDELAATGLRCSNVYTSDAPCLPSRTALYSGRFGIHTGVVGHGATAAQPKNEDWAAASETYLTLRAWLAHYKNSVFIPPWSHPLANAMPPGTSMPALTKFIIPARGGWNRPRKSRQ